MKHLNKEVPDDVYEKLRKYAYENSITMKQALIDAIRKLTGKDTTK